MPRRYATYLPQFATFHQLATLGAVLMFVGGLVWTYNFVVSWLEGPKVQDGDPWNLRDDDVYTNEWQWFENKQETALADGGDDSEELAADGGQQTDD
jgi:cytochrome c oxidase subunit 1